MEIDSQASPRRLPLFILGVVLFLLGPVAVAIQMFGLQRFDLLWLAPALGTLGILFMAASVWQRGGIARSVGLVAFLLLCGLEWFFVVFGTRVPAYEGPAVAGQKLPPFTTTLSDGATFTQSDLESNKATLLVFYRGHW